jgi:hypothetical protein
MEFEKTKPIFERPNRCKVLFERILQKYNTLRGTKKQSQFIPKGTKPISLAPSTAVGLKRSLKKQSQSVRKELPDRC